MTTKVTRKTVDVRVVLENVDPKSKHPKEVAYEFSNGRKFHNKKKA